MKLAPSWFDPAVADRDAAASREALAWRRQWEPLLEKVYGPASQTDSAADTDQWTPRFPASHRTRLAVERQLAILKLCITIGHREFSLFRQKQSHALITLPGVARLLEIAVSFGRLAVGLETSRTIAPPLNSAGYLSPEEALRKIYGREPATRPLP